MRQLVLDLAMAAFGSIFAVLSFGPPICMEGGLYHWLFECGLSLAAPTGFGLEIRPVASVLCSGLTGVMTASGTGGIGLTSGTGFFVREMVGGGFFRHGTHNALLAAGNKV